MSRTLCCIAVLWAAACADAAAQNIALAPAFTPSDLTAPPRQHWITNGGNLFNQRYSPLTRINRENVGQLRALWRTSMGSGAGFRDSGQAQILAFAGVLYVANGENDVFAMDVKTGAILWRHTGAPDVGSGNPLGWATRGDGIWMFALSGTMNSLPPPGGGGVGGSAFGGAQRAAVDDGRPGDPTLVDGVDAATIAAIAASGRNTMPAFGSVYSAADFRDVTSYILERLAQD